MDWCCVPILLKGFRLILKSCHLILTEFFLTHKGIVKNPEKSKAKVCYKLEK